MIEKSHLDRIISLFSVVLHYSSLYKPIKIKTGDYESPVLYYCSVSQVSTESSQLSPNLNTQLFAITGIVYMVRDSEPVVLPA